MPSLSMRLTAWGARRLVKSALEAPTCDLALIRRRMGIRRWLPSVLPSGLTVTPTTLGGVRCDWLTPRGARTDRAILYFHGGGYIGGSARSMRALAAWVAAAARTPVCAVEYRLAPEHPFPAAFDDAMAVYGAVLAAGIAPARLAMIYVDDAEATAEALDLVQTEAGANVWLLQPFDDVVFERARQRVVAAGDSQTTLTIVSHPQAVVDLLSSPGRGPQEAESLLEKMKTTLEEWQRVARP